MANFPRFRLYESDGTTLIYEFENTIDIEDFQDPARFIEHKSLRARGSIVSEGGDDSWTLPLSFIIKDVDYENLVAQINTLPSTIQKFTKYILKVDLTISTTKDYKVMRVNSIEFPLINRQKRVKFQTVNINFLVDCWA